MYIFDFLLDFIEILHNWTTTLWEALNYNVNIFDIQAPLYAVLGVGGIAGLFVINLIKNIVD